MKHIIRIEIDSIRFTVLDGATPEGHIQLEQELSFTSDEDVHRQLEAILHQLDRLAKTAGFQAQAYLDGAHR